MGADLVDASRLAARYEDEAAPDRSRAGGRRPDLGFGHVIVDEAQELSQMAWRMLMRRCPARSLTIVGDVAQTGDLAGLRVMERGARAVPGGPVAAGPADRQLPDPGRGHGSRGGRAGGD